MKNSELLNIAPILVESLADVKHMRLSYAVRKNAQKLAAEEKLIREAIRGMQSDDLHALLVKATEKIAPAFSRLKAQTNEAYKKLLREAVEEANPGEKLLKEFDQYTKERTEFLNEENDIELHKVRLSTLDDRLEINPFQMELISYFLDEDN